MITGSSLSSSTLSALFNLNSVYQQFNATATSLATGFASLSASNLIASTQLQSALAYLAGESYGLQQVSSVAATADAALGEVSDLLTEAEGIAVQLADGGLSDEEVDALQLELDSIAASVSLIGQTTTFAGTPLLTGDIALSAAGASVTLPSLDDLGLDDLDAADAEAVGAAVEAAQETISTAQGELGALQDTTIASYQDVLSSSIIELTTASSFITDTNYAFALASLAQYQVLSQASLLVLGLANQSTSGVYELLG